MVIYAYQRASYVCIAKNLLQLNSKSKRQNHIRNEKNISAEGRVEGKFMAIINADPNWCIICGVHYISN